MTGGCCASEPKMDGLSDTNLKIGYDDLKPANNPELSKNNPELSKEISLPYPVKVTMIDGEVQVSNNVMTDELGVHEIKQGDTIPMHTPIKFFNSSSISLERVLPEPKQATTENFIKQKYSFAILLFALSGSFIALKLGLDPVLAFIAILMCVCPCIFLQVDAIIINSGIKLFDSQGLKYNKPLDDFIPMLAKVSKPARVKYVADSTGTLAYRSNEGGGKVLRDQVSFDSDQGFSISSKDGEIPITVLTGSNAPIKFSAVNGKGSSEFAINSSQCEKLRICHSCNANQKGEEITKAKQETSVLFIGNNDNDIKALEAADVSIAVKNSSIQAKQNADFISNDENKELLTFANFPYYAKKIIRFRNIFYGIAILYALTIIPLVLGGYVTPMWACIAMSAAGVGLMLLSKIYSYWLLKGRAREIKVSANDKTSCLNALEKMRKFKPGIYSSEQISAQEYAAGQNKPAVSVPKSLLASSLLAIMLGLSFIKSLTIHKIIHYAYLPSIIIGLTLALSLKKFNSYKIIAFVLCSAAIVAAEYVLPKQLPKIKLLLQIVGLVMAVAALYILYNNCSLNMYEVQISAILLLALADYTKLAKIHTHHLFIMAIVLIMANLIKYTAAANSPVTAFKDDDIPDCTKFPKSTREQLLLPEYVATLQQGVCCCSK